MQLVNIGPGYHDQVFANSSLWRSSNVHRSNNLAENLWPNILHS